MVWFLKSYYLYNFLVCAMYPLFRYYNYHNNNYQFYKSSTYERENHVVISFMSLVLIKYLRHFTSLQQLVYEFVFYCKLGFTFLFFLYSYTLCFWYSILVMSCWIFVKLPVYNGPSKIINIIGDSRFKDLVVNKKHKNNKKDNYSFVVFHSLLSDKCIFVRKSLLF